MDTSPAFADVAAPPGASREDWAATAIGLLLVGLLLAAWLLALPAAWLAPVPAKWSSPAALLAALTHDAPRYAALLALLAAFFTAGTAAAGIRPARFLPGFLLLVALSLAILAAGAWASAAAYNLEPPLLALGFGLLLSNLTPATRLFGDALRVEFTIKVGIVLLGATLPLTLIAYAGPVAMAQAAAVSLITFGTIYAVAVRLGIDRRFAAVLGAGGAVCGVSAAVAVAGAVRARREHASIAITLVIVWAIAMIFALPLAARALHLPTGVAGAWIGTSEFADAAGLAAAQAYGGLAGPATGIAGTQDQAIQAYTLLKVLGRDIWIGVWALALAWLALRRWDASPAAPRPRAAQIWDRFPKFVLGFLIASIAVTLAVRGHTLADYTKQVKPALITPISNLRLWAFTLSFLSIGLGTRFRALAPATGRPLAAFTAGVAVNVTIGFLLSVVLFRGWWAAIGR